MIVEERVREVLCQLTANLYSGEKNVSVTTLPCTCRMVQLTVLYYLRVVFCNNHVSRVSFCHACVG